MIQKNMLKILVLLSVFALVALTLPVRAADDAGKKLFVDNKCNSCHSVDSQGIAKTMAGSKAPDLSKVGANHDAAWFSKYLNKEVDVDGKKHVKGWTGSKEDLEALSNWLATLK
jgi:cbb3-type cytochrome oxidase cytochrome c subunit